MAITRNDNLQILAGKPIDSRYYNSSGTAYTSTSQALSEISLAYRYIGLVVNINGTEYSFKDNVNTLVLYNPGATIWEEIDTAATISYLTGDVTISNDFSLEGSMLTDIDINSNSLLNVTGLNFASGETITWNTTDYTLNIPTGLGPVLQVNQETVIIVYNNTVSPIENGKVIHTVPGATGGRPHVEKAISNTHEGIDGNIWITTMEIPAYSIGIATKFGYVRDIDTSLFNVGDTIWISSSVAGEFVNVFPEFPNYPMEIGEVTTSSALDGIIVVDIKGDIEDTVKNFWNGVIRERFDFFVTSDGFTITGSLSPSDGHPDLTLLFSDGFTNFTATPDVTITLTPGTDTVPVTNYVYIPESTKVLTVSTSDWPVTSEYIKIARVFVKSAATTALDGALRNQNINDAIQDTITFQGHLSHITENIRMLPAKWVSGTKASVTLITASTPDDVYISVTGGVVQQMHRQSFTAFDMQTGDNINIVNDFVTPYHTTTNLNTEITDALGNSLNNTSFSYVIWGVINKTGEVDQVMLNKPSGSYAFASPDTAVNDALNYSVYTIPKEFEGVGFLIARATFTYKNDVWTIEETEDLTGTIPNTAAGGGAGGGTGVTTFLGLTDTPISYSGEGLNLPSVNSAETALEFVSYSDINYWSLTADPYLYYNGGNVGIGTATPSTKMHILTTTTNNSLLTIEADDGDAGISMKNDTNTFQMSVRNDVSDNLVFRINAADKIGIDSSGNVGIGTTSPSTLLHLAHNSVPNIRLSDIGATTTTEVSAIIEFYQGLTTSRVGYIGFGSSTDDNLTITNLISGGDILLIPTSGNVGIGTSSPSNPLHVQASIDTVALFESTDAISRIEIKDSTSSAYIIQNGTYLSLGYATTPASQTLFVTSNSVGIGTDSPGQLLDIYGGIGTHSYFRITSDDQFDGIIEFWENGVGRNGKLHYDDSTKDFYISNVYASDSADLILETQDTPRITIKGSGNVGIGTDTPYNLLDVGGMTTSVQDNIGNLGVKTDSNHIAIRLQENGGSEEWSIGVDASGDLNFHDSGSATPSITFQDDTGNIGIGTTSPASNLHIKATTNPHLILENVTTANDAIIDLMEAGDDFGVTASNGIRLMMDGADNNFYIKGGVGASVKTALSIDRATGFVGIGDVTPTEQLHIKTAIGVSTDLGLDEDGSGWRIRNDQSDNRLSFYSASGSFDTFSSELVTISSAGNVGIGTTSPSELLHLQKTSGSARMFIETTDTGGESSKLTLDSYRSTATSNINQIDFKWAGTATANILHKTGTDTVNKDDGSLEFRTASAGTLITAMTIDSSQNIGIGTTSPATALDVNGTITFNGLVGTAGATATIINTTFVDNDTSLMTSAAIDNQIISYGYSTTVGTVTSVATLTLGTTGTDLSSSVANGTTTPVITLNVPTASATNRGALSSANWTTFNNKANTASPTFTGLVTTSNLKVEGQSYYTMDSLTDAVSITTDCDDGNLHQVTLTDNRTLAAPTNPQVGVHTWIVTQDAGGTNTLNLTAFTIKGETLAIDLAGSSVSILTGIYNGSTWYMTILI